MKKSQREKRQRDREKKYPDVVVGVHIILVVDNDVAIIDTRIDGVARWDLEQKRTEGRT
jgi:hypothetical protein